MEDIHAKEIQLVRTTVKIPGGRPRGSESVPSAGGQLSAGSRLTNGQSKALDSSNFRVCVLIGYRWRIAGVFFVLNKSSASIY
jgi:hypothetical protein